MNVIKTNIRNKNAKILFIEKDIDVTINMNLFKDDFEDLRNVKFYYHK